MPMRSLPRGVMSREVTNGQNRVGTSRKTPSGSGTGLPRLST